MISVICNTDSICFEISHKNTTLELFWFHCENSNDNNFKLDNVSSLLHVVIQWICLFQWICWSTAVAASKQCIVHCRVFTRFFFNFLQFHEFVVLEQQQHQNDVHFTAVTSWEFSFTSRDSMNLLIYSCSSITTMFSKLQWFH